MEALLAEYGIYSPVLPSIAGTCSGKKLVICGDGRCIWEDLFSFGCASDADGGSIAKPGWDFMCVNMAGSKFPGIIEHWYSNDAAKIAQWRAVRREEYPPKFTVNNTHSCNEGAQWFWPWTGHGTSGLGATITGLWLDYDEIVLCGIPLDNRPHNGEPPWRKTNFTNEVRNDEIHWMRVAEKFAGRVTAMSGQPRKWFGPPIV